MALRKKKETNEGFALEYWRIDKFEIDRTNSTAIITVMPYISQKKRQQGSAPVESERMRVRIEDLQYPTDMRPSVMHFAEYFSAESIESNGLYSIMYNYLKTHVPFFKDAEDI